MIDFNVFSLSVFSAGTGLGLPGVPHGLLDNILGLIGVAITNGGLFVVAVEFQEIFLSGLVLESLGFFNDFFKLKNRENF